MRSSLFLAFLFFAQTSQAVEFICPESISVRETVSTPQEEWSSLRIDSDGVVVYSDVKDNGAKYLLQGVTVYSGEPKDMASLAPDNKGSPNQDQTGSIWSFGSSDLQRTYPIYFSCNYLNTRVALYKRVEFPVKKCTWLHASNRFLCNPA